MTIFLYALFSVFSAYEASSAVAFDLAARDEPLKRTLFGIIWSCLSTTILCAWTAVHPNVPPESKWQARWNRLELMFWMIVAPELVLAWAVRQFFAAKEIRDAYNHSREGKCGQLLLEVKVAHAAKKFRTGIPVWRQWTLAHGHLLGMGGFTLVDPDLRTASPKDQNGQVLTIDRFKELIERRDFDLPDITEEDIEDRSKGDILFKLIAILQTSWFIIQCIARGQQRLALTELELVTLALASLNAVTFAIWWHKPLGVQKPVRIYLKIEARIVVDVASVDDLQRDRRVDLSFGDVIRRLGKEVKKEATSILDFLRNPCEYGPKYALLGLFIVLPFALTTVISFPFFVMFPLGIVLLLKIIETEPVPSETSQSRGLLAARIVVSLQSLRYRLSSAVGKYVGRWLEEIFGGGAASFLFGWFVLLPVLFFLLFLFVIFLIPFLTLLLLVPFIFTAVFGIVTTSTIRPDAPHVPSFYASTTNSDRWSRMAVFALFGVIFGGLHCIGWFFEYPTHSEQTLWRAMSLAITVIPLIVAPIDLLLATRLRIRDIKSCETFERTALLALDFIMTILLFIYVPARLCLIALALASLRTYQLSTAHFAIDWTQYVPHLFS